MLRLLIPKVRVRRLRPAIRSGRQTQGRKRLILEILEDRTTPSVAAIYQVIGLGDSPAHNSAAVVDTNHAGTAADPFLAPSLRSAVLAANASGGSSLINFAPSLTQSGPAAIYLGIDGDDTFGPSALYITSQISIVGPTANGITLARDIAAQPTRLRLFDVALSGSLTLENLTLSGGLAQGGTGTGGGGGGAGLGGAIVNQGTLQLLRDTLSFNQALGGNGSSRTTSGSGGGLGGDAVNFSMGGPPNGANATGTPPTYDGGFGGGGTQGGNGGFGGGGGAGGLGGGGNGGFGGGAGGGIAGFGGASDPFEGGPGAGMGGAVFNYAGTVFITDSTLANNAAIGGTTFIHPHRASGLGGGVLNLNGTLTVTNSTFAFNDGSDGSGICNVGSGGEVTGSGPALPVRTATVILNNSVLAGANPLINDFRDFTPSDAGTSPGTVSVTGTNDMIRLSDTSDSLAGILDLVYADPLLGALASNGGPTATSMPAAGSPTIDGGSNAAAVDPAAGNVPLSTDQRGADRVVSGTVDIGAVEVVTSTTTVQIEHFVTRVYRDLLGRTPDSAGLNNWVNQFQVLLGTGMSWSAAEQAVVYQIETNAAHEYFINVVHGYYEQYLSRQEGASDAAGFALDVALLAYGAATWPQGLVYAETQLAMNFMLSPEYAATHGGADNAAFVEGVYSDALRRTAAGDPGAARCVAALNAGIWSRAEVVAGVLLSDEFEIGQVMGWYQQFLGRTIAGPDTPHVQYLVHQLQAGTPEVVIIASLMGDPQQEYFTSAQS
jgi:hypothetical protein